MEIFKLIEKRNDNVGKITYLVKLGRNTGGPAVYLLSTTSSSEKAEIFISGELKETKRGWTFNTWWLTSKPIKVFLPRENFEKVEIQQTKI